MNRRQFSQHAFALAAASTLPEPSFAQAWPTKPIKIVVPFPPGGATDILTREIGNRLGEMLKTQVVIENKPGAGGTIGTEIVKNAAADGYTLTMGTSSNHAIAKSVYKSLPYDTLKDFVALSLVANSFNIIVINPDIPAKTLKEFVELAKKEPGKYTFGSSGNGTISHLTGEYFNTLNTMKITHVPYKGSAQAIPDLVSGNISMMYDSVLSIMPMIKSGKVRALAVTSATRSKLFPDLPTVAESGYPGFESTNWFGLFLPAATPKDIVVRLNRDVNKTLADPALVEKFAQQGAEPVGTSVEEFTEIIRKDTARWAEVVKISGAKVD